MNSALAKQNPSSWSSLFAAHLDAVKKRSAAALSATGYDSLLVHAGTPPLLFLDDHHLPFKVQAPFKVWAPLLDAPDSFLWFTPGKKPVLLLHAPVDYWHKSPETPRTYWSGCLRHRELPRSRRRPRRVAEGLVAQRVHRRAVRGTRVLGTRRHQSRTPDRAARLWPCGQDALRDRGAARGQRAGRARPRGRREGLPCRRQRVRHRSRVHGRLRTSRTGAAVQPDHRAQRRWRGVALPGAEPHQTRKAALAAHRRRRRVRGLRLRHHAHALVRQRGVRRAHPQVRRTAAQTLRAGPRRHGLAGHPPGVLSRHQRIPGRGRM